MIIFGTEEAEPAGCFFAINVDASKGAGALMELPDGNQFPNTDQLNIIILELSFEQNESFSLQRCFDDVNYIYTFGNGVGSVLVSFIVLTKGGSKQNGDGQAGVAVDNKAIQEVLTAYNDNRLFEARKPVKVSFGGAGTILSGYMTGMKSNTRDTMHNIQAFSFTMLSTKLQGQDTSEGG